MMNPYETLEFDVIACMLTCDPIIKNFKIGHDSLVERKSLAVTVHRESNNLDANKSTEAFLNLLARLVGARIILLIHVAQDEVEVKNDATISLPPGS